MLTGLSFTRVSHRTVHRWDWDVIFHDMDGSLTGTPDAVVVAADNITLNHPSCLASDAFSNGVVCTNTSNWIQFAFNAFDPEFVVMINVTNAHGDMSTIPRLVKRLTHPKGFMTALEARQEYLMILDQTFPPHNITFTGTYYQFYPGDYLIIKHQMAHKPDYVQFKLKTFATESFDPLSYENNNSTDWFWDNSTYTLSYILSNKQGIEPFLDIPISFAAINCRYSGCSPPTGYMPMLPVTSRPANALFWSKLTTWMKIGTDPEWAGYRGLQLPQFNESVLIPYGSYVVIDCAVPPLRFLQIEGILELDNGYNHTIEAEMIFINGGQLIVGWEVIRF